MNTIRTVMDILENCDLIRQNFSELNFDFSDQTVRGKAGVFQNGHTKLSETITGDERHRLNFTLYASSDAFEDIDRLQNGDFLMELSYFLGALRDIEVTERVNGKDRPGKIESISSSNGMLCALNNDNFKDGGIYQLQISVQYKISGGD